VGASPDAPCGPCPEYPDPEHTIVSTCVSSRFPSRRTPRKFGVDTLAAWIIPRAPAPQSPIACSSSSYPSGSDTGVPETGFTMIGPNPTDLLLTAGIARYRFGQPCACAIVPSQNSFSTAFGVATASPASARRTKSCAANPNDEHLSIVSAHHGAV